MMKLVQTEPTSAFDALWRAFPQLKNATCVGRLAGGATVIRTFRTLEGNYVRITSTDEGDAHSIPPADEIEVYEEVWKRLRSPCAW
jgi:hypothetical protein